MARKFLDIVRADFTAQLTTGNNTNALQLNALIQDMIDSTVQDECTLESTAPTTGVAVNGTPIVITAYQQSVGGDGSFLKPTFSAGQVQVSPTAGFTYNIGCSLSFIGDANQRYDFTLLRNGAPFGLPTSATGQGAGDPVPATLRDFERSALADAVYSVAVSTPDAAGTIDILSAVMWVVVQPTNNP